MIQNILEDTIKAQPRIQKTNLAFLEQEKQQLDIQINQLKLNNKVLRNVINNLQSQLSLSNNNEEDSLIIKELTERNRKLEQKFCECSLLVKNQFAEIILNKQIAEYSQKQLSETIKNYQQKILELRRSVQNKQTYIQKYESIIAIDLDEVQNVVPPYNVSIHFYNQFAEYKELLEKSRLANLRILQENKKLKDRIDQLQKLAFLKKKSPRVSLDSYSERIKRNQEEFEKNENENEKSEKIDQKKKEIQYKNFDIAEYTNTTLKSPPTVSNRIVVTLNKIIHKHEIQIKMLKQKMNELLKKNSSLVKMKESLVQSNIFYKKSQKQLQNKINLNQQLLNNLINIFLSRKSNYCQEQLFKNIIDDNFCPLERVRAKSLLATKKKQQNAMKMKQVWLEMEKTMPKQFECIPYRPMVHSRSCIFDYIKQQQPKKSTDKLYQDDEDYFDKILEDKDFEFIGGSYRKNKNSQQDLQSGNFESFLDDL